MKNKVIEVQNIRISISKQELDDYICITDIAKAVSTSFGVWQPRYILEKPMRKTMSQHRNFRDFFRA